MHQGFISSPPWSDKPNQHDFVKQVWCDELKDQFRSGIISKLPVFNTLTEHIHIQNRSDIDSMIMTLLLLYRVLLIPCLTNILY